MGIVQHMCARERKFPGAFPPRLDAQTIEYGNQLQRVAGGVFGEKV